MMNNKTEKIKFFELSESEFNNLDWRAFKEPIMDLLKAETDLEKKKRLKIAINRKLLNKNSQDVFLIEDIDRDLLTTDDLDNALERNVELWNIFPLKMLEEKHFLKVASELKFFSLNFISFYEILTDSFKNQTLEAESFVSKFPSSITKNVWLAIIEDPLLQKKAKTLDIDLREVTESFEETIRFINMTIDINSQNQEKDKKRSQIKKI